MKMQKLYKGSNIYGIYAIHLCAYMVYDGIYV